MSNRGTHRFPTTHLSVILDAAGRGQGDATKAVAQVCSSYWFPLYTYVRRSGFSIEDAQDLTQQFFVVILEREYLRQFEPGRGKLRTFLIVALKHFLSNERDRLQAHKRGGGVKAVQINIDENAEMRYVAGLRDEDTPEKVYERQWARTLLDRCREELRSEYERTGRLQLFDGISVDEGATVPYSQTAASLGMSEGALKVAVHRLRRRLRELLRRHINETVCHADDVADEVRYLLTIVEK